jgi:hypothetical protein
MRVLDIIYYSKKKQLVIKEIEKQNEEAVREWINYLLNKGFKNFIFIIDDRVAGYKHDLLIMTKDGIFCKCEEPSEDDSIILDTNIDTLRKFRWMLKITYIDDRYKRDYVRLPPNPDIKI